MIRPATAVDVATADITWLRPDSHRPGHVALVDTDHDRIVAAAMRFPNGFHPTTYATFLATQTGDPGILHELAKRGDLALTGKAKPGTLEHQAWLAAGGTKYQELPPQRFMRKDPQLQQWCDQHQTDTSSGSNFSTHELVQFWARQYHYVHASWNPSADHDTLTAKFRLMIEEELDQAATRIALLAGKPVAAAFTFYSEENKTTEIIAEAIEENPQVRQQVAGCIAAAIKAARGDLIDFDGHATDPHFAPILASMPNAVLRDDHIDLLMIKPKTRC